MSEPERQLKRQRISQACDYCRKRKSKCDGLQPVCSVCRLFKKPCTYGNVKKRGLQTGYVRGLESLLGLVLQHMPGSEALIQSLLRHDYADVSFIDGEFMDRTTDQWRTSNLAKDLDVLLGSFDSESSHAVTSQGSRLAPLPQVVRDAGCLPPGSSGEQRIENTEPAVPSDVSECYQEISPPLLSFPDDLSDFVDLYFQTTQCWFPILERRDILRTMYDEDETALAHQPYKSMTGHRICLWAIIVYSSKLKGNLRPSAIPGSWQIQAHIWSTLMSNSQALDLGHIQAALILALHELNQGVVRSAWVLTAQAYRMQAILAGQGLETPERKQHVFQGCLYLDTVLSALLGQPPLQSHRKYNGIPHIDENSVEEWESWTSPSQTGLRGPKNRQPLRVLSTFNLLTHLMQKMTKFLEYPVEGSSFDETVRDLQNWYFNLKKQHQINERGCSTPPILLLHLTWDFVLLTLFRWTCRIERRWLQLIEGTARSTLAMLNQYMELTEVSSALPLSWTFAQQAHACLERLNWQLGRTDESALDLQLKEMLQTLEHRCGDQASSEYDGLHALDGMRRLPSLAYKTSSSMGHRIEKQPTTYFSGASLHDSSAPAEASTPQAQYLPPDATLAAFIETERPSDEANEFDDVFDEMLTFVPSRR